MRQVLVTVEGTDLPGRRCGPKPEGGWCENVHVGLCDRSSKGPPLIDPRQPWGLTGLVRGDAERATWEIEVMVKERDDGLDFSGPVVRGKRDDRHIGLAWGEMPDEATFILFRGAKLRFDAVDPGVVREANQPGMRLVARVGLTDAQGWPLCASVRPPVVTWTAETALPPPRQMAELRADGIH